MHRTLTDAHVEISSAHASDRRTEALPRSRDDFAEGQIIERRSPTENTLINGGVEPPLTDPKSIALTTELVDASLAHVAPPLGRGTYATDALGATTPQRQNRALRNGRIPASAPERAAPVREADTSGSSAGYRPRGARSQMSLITERSAAKRRPSLRAVEGDHLSSLRLTPRTRAGARGSLKRRSTRAIGLRRSRSSQRPRWRSSAPRCPAHAS